MPKYFSGWFIVVCFLFTGLVSQAQNISKENLTKLKKGEDTLKVYAIDLVQNPNASKRFISDSIFIRSLVANLKTPHSFYFAFDSLETISRLYAPDSSFRIFTWQFSKDENYFRQRGAIQMKTTDGSLKLFPLIDISEFTDAPRDSVRSHLNWIGAIYYRIIQKSYNNKQYYTLLGFDDNNMRTSKKYIEVMTFDEKGNPQFGGDYFLNPETKLKPEGASARFEIEYKKDGKARLNFDKDLDIIIFDHLISESNKPEKKQTLVPDGDYMGFKWTDGIWVLIDKVFNFALEDGQAPVPMPIKEQDAKSKEEFLKMQTDKSKTKAPKAAPKKQENKKEPLEMMEEY